MTTPFFAHTAEAGANFPTLQHEVQPRTACAPDACADVGDDAEREAEIARHGRQMLAAYARYERSSSFADVGQAHFHRMRMYALIRGRSAGQVAKLEQERGLA